MDDIDFKIIEAINTVSPKSFVSPVKVNEVLKLDANQLGTRLMLLKKSGHVDIVNAGQKVHRSGGMKVLRSINTCLLLFH